ncbi:MerR family transcriptional regulator [Paenibacillus arenilitoris]|uniref:MerR family transcriptional regulator n=1 Tax=Paenibacillus arenilitoris TaxID=2772299 RepID=A0A927H5L6_9BACL|nr:MerR family transcriptional regulator [Paenibacillus arenilitoris]MBD2868668.1 MerR family transcriptional regulator [Paenibacillus arenilitoris]
MTNVFTPAQIASELNVSTTTLRRYEEQGLIPDVPRTTGNHRTYTSVHVQAFTAIRLLLMGFEIPVVYDAMRKIKHGDIMDAIWLVNNQLHDMQFEKQRVEDVLAIIKNTDFSQYRKAKLTDSMTIGKVAELAGVNTSAIRHWEKEGLVTSKRDPENGYRMFTESEMRKIFVISSLRKTIYYIENLKDLLKDLEIHNFSKLDRSFRLALQRLDHKLLVQFQGVSELMKYIALLDSFIRPQAGQRD